MVKNVNKMVANSYRCYQDISLLHVMCMVKVQATAVIYKTTCGISIIREQRENGYRRDSKIHLLLFNRSVNICVYHLYIDWLISCLRSSLVYYSNDCIGFKNANGTTELLILTHWGRVTHICVGKLAIIGSDNGLSPKRRQPIIWTNAGILLIGPLGTNFSEILIGCHTFSFTKMHLKMSSGKWRPFCLGLNVLNLI